MTPARLAVALSLLVACRDKTEPAPVPAVPQPGPKDRDDLVTYQDMVAVSATGRAFVTRKDSQVTVWTRAGTKRGVLDAFGSGDPGDRYAISANGDRLAELTAQRMRVVDVETKKVVWDVDERTVVWGDPVFSPDDKILAVPLEGSVSLVDAATGKELAALDADNVAPGYPVGRPLSLPRTLVYSPDGTHLAITCGTDAEGFANHAVFVADTRANKLVWVVLGHFGFVVDLQWLPDGRLVTEDEVGELRVIKDGLVEQTLALAQAQPGPIAGVLAVAADLKTVALGGEDAIHVWRARGGLVEIPRHRVDDPVVRLELRPDSVVALSRKGGVVRAYSIPQRGQAAPEVWDAVDPAAQRREAGLWRIANGENPKITDDAQTKAARAFATWQHAGAHGTFRGPFDLDLAQRYLDGGLVDEVHVLLAAWLATHRRGDDEDDYAKKLGLELAADERDDDVEQPIVAALYARWPDDAEVVTAYADGIGEPKLAIAALRKATVKMPHEVDLWRTWLEIAEPDQGPVIYASARKVLTADELRELPAPK